MEYRHVADMNVSRLGLGTMTFGAQVDERTAVNMVALCRERGITVFDTANSYSLGEAERLLGRAVKNCRSQVIIASKVFNPMGDSPADRGLSAPAIRKAIEASLTRLGTDYLDIYYMHAPDRSVPIEETLSELSLLVSAGKIRHIGVSNHPAWQIARMSSMCDQFGWPPIEFSQPMYNLVARRIEDEYLECAAGFGLYNMTYNPLAGGLLTGKHSAESTMAGGRFFGERGDRYRRRYWNAEQFDAVRSLSHIASGAGLTLIELSVRWLLTRASVGTVLLGASSMEQLAENISASADFHLAPDAAAACDMVWAGLGGVAPPFAR